MDAPILHLTAWPVTLVRCSPLAAAALSRAPGRLAGEDMLLYALGACALVECWPEGSAWPVQPPPRKWRPGESMETRGQVIFDALATAGIQVADAKRAALLESGDEGALAALPITDLLTACQVAYEWASRSLISQRELDAARDFSGAPKGG